MDEVETTGRTSEQAIEKALRQLGKERSEVEVEVLRESSGSVLNLLGIGAARVRVRVREALPKGGAPSRRSRRGGRGRRKHGDREEQGERGVREDRGRRDDRSGREDRGRRDDRGGRSGRVDREERRARPEPAKVQEQQRDRPERAERQGPVAEAAPGDTRGTSRGAANAKEARELVRAALRHMDIEADVRVTEDAERRSLEIEIGKTGSILIGRKGQTLDAFEYLLGRMINGEEERWVKITVDVDGYRRSREDQIAAKALAIAEIVKREGRPHKSEPMNAQDRRLFHLALKPDEQVDSKSFGGGPLRRVTVFLAGQEPAEEPEEAVESRSRRPREEPPGQGPDESAPEDEREQVEPLEDAGEADSGPASLDESEYDYGSDDEDLEYGTPLEAEEPSHSDTDTETETDTETDTDTERPA